jgi:hypothetical protein
VIAAGEKYRLGAESSALAADCQVGMITTIAPSASNALVSNIHLTRYDILLS